MTSAIKAANRILQIAKAKGKPLTPLQLMKLTYMSQGWTLALLGRELFPDRIEAWQYGPVIPSLYRAVKQYGSEVISGEIAGLGSPVPVQEDEDKILNDVVENYGHLTGNALSNLTHRPGSPWSQVWNKDERNILIPISVIRAHYEKLKDAPSVSAA